MGYFKSFMRVMKMHFIKSLRETKKTLKEEIKREVNQGDHNHRGMRRREMRKVKK